MLFACAVTAYVPSSKGIDLRTCLDFVEADTAADASAIFMATARDLVPKAQTWHFTPPITLPAPVFTRAQNAGSVAPPPEPR